MTDKLSFEEVKGEVVKRLEAWYEHDANMTSSHIYEHMQPGNRRGKLETTEEISKYVDNYMLSNPKINFYPGADLFSSLVINDLISDVSEKWLRRFLKKLQNMGNHRRNFQVMSDYWRDLDRSLRMTLRGKRRVDFVKRYRQELLCLQFQEARFRLRPLVWVGSAVDSSGLWSPIPVKYLIDYQLSVISVKDDIEGWNLYNGERMSELQRLSRLSAIEAGNQLISDSCHLKDTIRVNDFTACGLFGADVKTNAKHALGEAHFSALSVISESVKKIKGIHATGHITPYSYTFELYNRFTSHISKLSGADTERYKGLVFSAVQEAVIYRDLCKLIEDHHHLYGAE